MSPPMDVSAERSCADTAGTTTSTTIESLRYIARPLIRKVGFGKLRRVIRIRGFISKGTKGVLTRRNRRESFGGNAIGTDGPMGGMR